MHGLRHRNARLTRGNGPRGLRGSNGRSGTEPTLFGGRIETGRLAQLLRRVTVRMVDAQGRRRPRLGVTSMKRVFAVAACGLTLSACGSWMPSLELSMPSFGGGGAATGSLAVESDPPGAQASAGG